MATVFAGIAQFERDLKSEPINPALLPSKRAAKSGADTPVNARSQNASPPKVIALIKEGRSHRWIACNLGISKNTVLTIAQHSLVKDSST